ncbi:MAG TPA: KTSC domain-containing protein [Candidatus Paenibacillus intestinavium]|nr:KTSC domain-containing protein [Candidatus Paenibacillus intestinavium]
MENTNLIPVVSSNIAAVGYDSIQNVLSVQFKGKQTIYVYQGVPVETYQLMMVADSIGSFYARHIKKVYQSEVRDCEN